MAEGQWGDGNLPKGQPKATWYDRYGRSFVLPVDPLHSEVHYRERGLGLTPPKSPLPLPDSEFGRYALASDDPARVPAPVSATRQVVSSEPPAEQSDIQMLLARIEELEATRKRGPDKKKRKRRRKRTPS